MATDNIIVEKRIVMPHGQNTVHLTYRVVEGTDTVRFNLRPSVHFRGYEAAVDESPVQTYTIAATGRQYELSAGPDLPILRMMLTGSKAALTLDEKGASGVPYQMEETRGYQWKGSLWSPGYFRADAQPGEQVSLVASAEPWETVLALSTEAVTAAEQERTELGQQVEKLQVVAKERDELRQQLTVRTSERDSVQSQFEQFRSGIKNLLGQAEARSGSNTPPVTAASEGQGQGKS